jgi:hypothetical protein
MLRKTALTGDTASASSVTLRLRDESFDPIFERR